MKTHVKKYKARCFFWRQNNPEVTFSQTQSWGGGVFLEEVSCSRQWKRDFFFFWYMGLMDLQEVGGGCADWMELAEDRERWWALVNKVMNIWVP
jgi:hypothetical protein